MVSDFPLMASVKAALAPLSGNAAGERLAQPLRPLSADKGATPVERLSTTEFATRASGRFVS